MKKSSLRPVSAKLNTNYEQIRSLDIEVFTIPTTSPESDGTLQWDKTVLVTVHAHAAGKTGLGYTYADRSAALLIQEKLRDIVVGQSPFGVQKIWQDMYRAVRNLGRAGIASMAISAIDTALWDLKAKILGVPLAQLLGQVHEHIALYGSGGFTSYSQTELQAQLGGWADEGFSMVKMKIGREPDKDVKRVRAAREAIGKETRLFVDANGAYEVKQAILLGKRFSELGVEWYEEPVSSDHLSGLREIREGVPAKIRVAAGEYGYDLLYFKRMLEARAVDVLQADITRCGGVTGFLQASAICEAFSLPLSAHCAPSLHLHAACASAPLKHMEYFHDHVEIEKRFFDGYCHPKPHAESGMAMSPDLSRPGIGLELKRADAQKYAA